MLFRRRKRMWRVDQKKRRFPQEATSRDNQTSFWMQRAAANAVAENVRNAMFMSSCNPLFCSVMSCHVSLVPGQYTRCPRIRITILQGIPEFVSHYLVQKLSGSYCWSLSLLYFNTVIFSYQGTLPTVFVKTIKLKTIQVNHYFQDLVYLLKASYYGP